MSRRHVKYYNNYFIVADNVYQCNDIVTSDNTHVTINNHYK